MSSLLLTLFLVWSYCVIAMLPDVRRTSSSEGQRGGGARKGDTTFAPIGEILPPIASKQNSDDSSFSSISSASGSNRESPLQASRDTPTDFNRGDLASLKKRYSPLLGYSNERQSPLNSLASLRINRHNRIKSFDGGSTDSKSEKLPGNRRPTSGTSLKSLPDSVTEKASNVAKLLVNNLVLPEPVSKKLEPIQSKKITQKASQSKAIVPGEEITLTEAEEKFLLMKFDRHEECVSWIEKNYAPNTEGPTYDEELWNTEQKSKEKLLSKTFDVPNLNDNSNGLKTPPKFSDAPLRYIKKEKKTTELSGRYIGLEVALTLDPTLDAKLRTKVLWTILNSVAVSEWIPVWEIVVESPRNPRPSSIVLHLEHQDDTSDAELFRKILAVFEPHEDDLGDLPPFYYRDLGSKVGVVSYYGGEYFFDVLCRHRLEHPDRDDFLQTWRAAGQPLPDQWLFQKPRNQGPLPLFQVYKDLGILDDNGVSDVDTHFLFCNYVERKDCIRECYLAERKRVKYESESWFHFLKVAFKKVKTEFKLDHGEGEKKWANLPEANELSGYEKLRFVKEPRKGVETSEEPSFLSIITAQINPSNEIHEITFAAWKIIWAVFDSPAVDVQVIDFENGMSSESSNFVGQVAFTVKVKGGRDAIKRVKGVYNTVCELVNPFSSMLEYTNLPMQYEFENCKLSVALKEKNPHSEKVCSKVQDALLQNVLPLSFFNSWMQSGNPSSIGWGLSP